jgi:DNA mismatch repair protein MutS2
MAERELEELRQDARRIRHDLQAAGQPLDAIKRLEAEAFEMKANVHSPVENVTDAPEIADESEYFRLGDIVWVPSLKSEGEVTELSSQDAEVAIGRLRVRARLDELEKRSRSERKESDRVTGRSNNERDKQVTRGASPGLELDLRGAKVEDALSRIDNYLDAAYMAGLPFVRIIHGKGTGALRKAIRDVLHRHPLVSRYERGNEKEGGDGITVVNMADQQ